MNTFLTKQPIIVLVVSMSMYTTINFNQDCCGEFCPPQEPEPITVYDFDRQFNEKKYWLEFNQQTGQVRMCSQRLGIYPEFYRSAKIYCHEARQVPCPPGTPEHCTCWAADSVIVCYDNITGDVRVIHDQ